MIVLTDTKTAKALLYTSNESSLPVHYRKAALAWSPLQPPRGSVLLMHGHSLTVCISIVCDGNNIECLLWLPTFIVYCAMCHVSYLSFLLTHC